LLKIKFNSENCLKDRKFHTIHFFSLLPSSSQQQNAFIGTPILDNAGGGTGGATTPSSLVAAASSNGGGSTTGGTGTSQKDTTFTKIFVGGLPYHTSDKSLRDHFEVYGEIEEAVVITDRQTGKSRGYGFVSI
jgi:hypothetical protein